MRRLGAALALTLALALAFSQPANADGIDRTYVVGDEPLSMAVDPTDGRIFVGRSQDGFDGLVAIDPATEQVTTYVTSGTPNYLAVDPVHRRLYVSHHEGLVDVFDLTTMTIEATLPYVGGAGIAVDPTTRRVYVAGLSELWVIDGATNRVVLSRTSLPYETWMAVGIDPELHHVYVTNVAEYSDGSSTTLVRRSLVVLDDRDLSLIAEIPTDRYVRWGLAVDQTRHRIYLADSNQYTSPTLAVVDGMSRTIVGSVALPGFLGGLALGADTLYVSAINTGYHVLDPDTLAVRRSVSTAPFLPLLPILHPDGRLYLGGRETGPDVVAAISEVNHAPVIDRTSLDPSVPTTADTLTLTVSAIDGDFSEPLTSTYAWARNGVVISGETGSTLDLSRPGYGDKGDTITGSVTVSDPEGLTASDSASVVIANAAPALTLTLSNASPSADDVLFANAAASDADGDPITLTYEWSRNGVVISGATTASLDLKVHAAEGDRITIRVTATDDAGAVRVAEAGAFVIPPSGTFLYLKSQPGDYVGGGAEELYTSTSSFIEGSLPQGGTTLNARVIQGNYVKWWYLTIAAPAGQPLAVGSYTGAMRAAFRPAGVPGLDINGNGRGCNTLTGRFDVTALAFSLYGEVSLFDATFEQHCEGGSSALLGRLRLEISPPTPGVTLPPGSMTVPTSGTYLYMNQPSLAGGTYEQLYTSADSTISTSFTQGDNLFYASVIQGSYVHWWYVNIAAPLGQPLTAGSYIRAVRAMSRTGDSPGLDVYGDGTGCNQIKGKFDVDELSFAPTGELLVFQATFEQWCDASLTARYGRIRIENAPPPPPVALAVALREEGSANSKSGVATISGTVSCSRDVSVQVSGTLTQQVSKRVTVTGTFSTTVVCTAPSVPWSLSVTGDNGGFGPGQATASLSATACDPQCVTADATRLVKLNSSK